MREGRRELKRIAREAATEEIGKEILAFRERQRSNVHPLPQRSETYTTPAMEEAARAVEEIRIAQLGPQPIGISEEEEKAASNLIEMANARHQRPLPATKQEKYEQLQEDLIGGLDLPDKDLAWMKRYEMYLEDRRTDGQPLARKEDFNAFRTEVDPEGKSLPDRRQSTIERALHVWSRQADRHGLLL